MTVVNNTNPENRRTSPTTPLSMIRKTLSNVQSIEPNPIGSFSDSVSEPPPQTAFDNIYQVYDYLNKVPRRNNRDPLIHQVLFGNMFGSVYDYIVLAFLFPELEASVTSRLFEVRRNNTTELRKVNKQIVNFLADIMDLTGNDDPGSDDEAWIRIKSILSFVPLQEYTELYSEAENRIDNTRIFFPWSVTTEEQRRELLYNPKLQFVFLGYDPSRVIVPLVRTKDTKWVPLIIQSLKYVRVRDLYYSHLRDSKNQEMRFAIMDELQQGNAESLVVLKEMEQYFDRNPSSFLNEEGRPSAD